MTPEEREIIMSLIVYPGADRGASPESVLRRLGTTDGVALGLQMLRDALERKDSLNVEMAFIVCGVYGFTSEHVEPLVLLSLQSWHQQHEDIAWTLGKLGDPRAVDVLYKMANYVPDYLEFDENRALARKAIWALGSISSPAAKRKLRLLAKSDEEIIREFVDEQSRRTN